MQNVRVCEITNEHVPNLLELNNAHAIELSYLTEVEFVALLKGAFYARTVSFQGSELAAGTALIIAVDESNSTYTSPNFLWFKNKYPSFVYIDRVVVSKELRGKGIANLLYNDLFKAIRKSGRKLVACEVNTDPPNVVSDTFHEKLAFAEVGRCRLADKGKSVRYLTLELN